MPGNRIERVRMKARKFYDKLTSHSNLYVVGEPRLVRVGRVEYNDGKSSGWFRKFPEYDHPRNRYHQSRKIISFERGWVIEAKGYNHRGIWTHLEYAQAERDGVAFHYARNIMTNGTRASGL